jgi:hypothetical protein
LDPGGDISFFFLFSTEKMSLLPPEIHTALSQLLSALATPDNTVRTQAEEQLNNEWVNGRPDVLLMGLAEQIQGAENASVSCLGCFFFLAGRGFNYLFSPLPPHSFVPPIDKAGRGTWAMIVGLEILMYAFLSWYLDKILLGGFISTDSYEVSQGPRHG